MNKPLRDGAARIGSEEAEQFLIQEARLLDERRFREWMTLFTEDGTYWVPAMPDQQSPFNHASLFYDDRELMRTRIDRLEHPLIHSQTPPSRTMHLVSNVTVDPNDIGTGEIAVSSNVLMVEHRLERQRLFAGRQTHRLRYVDTKWLIVHKRVDLVNCDSAFEAMAVPI